MSERIAAEYMGLSLESGRVVAKFAISQSNAFEALNSLKTGRYNLIIEDIQKAKTEAQNRYLWALIGEIGKKINGSRAEDEEIYAQILDMAGAKVEYLAAKKGTEDRLRAFFRVIKIVDDWKKGAADMVTVKCYYGTSTMNREEVSKVIDTALSYAEKCGVATDYWKGLLNESC